MREKLNMKMCSQLIQTYNLAENGSGKFMRRGEFSHRRVGAIEAGAYRDAAGLNSKVAAFTFYAQMFAAAAINKLRYPATTATLIA
jgi:hypothetical protein